MTFEDLLKRADEQRSIRKRELEALERAHLIRLNEARARELNEMRRQDVLDGIGGRWGKDRKNEQ